MLDNRDRRPIFKRLMDNEFPLILAFGDSLVAGYGLAPSDGFAPQLERRLRANYPAARVIDAGLSGDTTAGALRRLPPLLSGLRRRPELAVVQIGPNNVFFGVSLAQTRYQLDAILTEFARCRIPVLLATVTPPVFLRSRTAAYVGIAEEVAARQGVPTCQFFPDGVLGHPAMVLADGLHPNARAIGLVVDGIIASVEQALTSPSPLDRSSAV